MSFMEIVYARTVKSVL